MSQKFPHLHSVFNQDDDPSWLDMDDPPKSIGIRYLTEEEHVLRMARTIWSVSRRRVTLVRGWDTLSPDVQGWFLGLARANINQIDRFN